jgi:hypothetical protein
MEAVYCTKHVFHYQAYRKHEFLENRIKSPFAPKEEQFIGKFVEVVSHIISNHTTFTPHYISASKIYYMSHSLNITLPFVPILHCSKSFHVSCSLSTYIELAFENPRSQKLFP